MLTEEKLGLKNIREAIKQKAFLIGYCKKCQRLIETKNHICPDCDSVVSPEKAERVIEVYDVLVTLDGLAEKLQKCMQKIKSDCQNEIVPNYYLCLAVKRKKILEELLEALK